MQTLISISLDTKPKDYDYNDGEKTINEKTPFFDMVEIKTEDNLKSTIFHLFMRWYN
jgi:hypothetical protein